MMADNRKLYDNLLKSGKVTEQELGDFNTFDSLLQDNTNAVKLYNNLRKNDLFTANEIGDENTFMSLVQSQVTPIEPEVETLDTKVEKAKEDIYGISTKPWYMNQLEPTENTFSKKIRELLPRSVISTEEGQPADILLDETSFDKVDIALDIVNNSINELASGRPSLTFVMPISNIPVNVTIGSKDIDKLVFAKEMLLKAQKIKEAPKKDGLKAFWQGLTSPIARDFLSIGINELGRNVYVMNASKKLQRGEELTDEEETLLGSYNLLQQIRSGKNLPQSYKIAAGVSEMIPYIVQFGITQGTSALVNQGIKGLVNAAGKTTIKNFAGKSLAYTGAAAAQATLMPMTYSNISERLIGEVSEKDGVLISRPKESTVSSITRGYINSVAETFGEGMGGILSGTVGNTAKKIALKKGFWETFSKSLQKTAGWNGFWEVPEEEVTGLIQSVVDNDWGFFTPSEQLTMIGTVALMSGVMYGMEQSGKKIDKIKEIKLQKTVESGFKNLEELNDLYPGIKESTLDIANSPVADWGDKLNTLKTEYNLDEQNLFGVVNFLYNNAKNEAYKESKSVSVKEEPIAKPSREATRYTKNGIEISKDVVEETIENAINPKDLAGLEVNNDDVLEKKLLEKHDILLKEEDLKRTWETDIEKAGEDQSLIDKANADFKIGMAKLRGEVVETPEVEVPKEEKVEPEVVDEKPAEEVIPESVAEKPVEEAVPETLIEQKVAEPVSEFKNKQLDIINKSNPMLDEIHTGIRSVDDIKTAQEAFQESIDNNENPTEDFTVNDIQNSLKAGKITVYSSYPIENGVFVTPSKMQAKSYSGTGKVYSKEVLLDDVAWIDSFEGQYAKVETVKEEKEEKLPEKKTEISELQPSVKQEVPKSEQKKATVKSPEARNYIGRIKNPDKKTYAEQYEDYILNGRKETEIPQKPKKLSALAAQAVQQQLNRFYPKDKPVSKETPQDLLLQEIEKRRAKNPDYDKEVINNILAEVKKYNNLTPAKKKIYNIAALNNKATIHGLKIKYKGRNLQLFGTDNKVISGKRVLQKEKEEIQKHKKLTDYSEDFVNFVNEFFKLPDYVLKSIEYILPISITSIRKSIKEIKEGKATKSSNDYLDELEKIFKEGLVHYKDFEGRNIPDQTIDELLKYYSNEAEADDDIEKLSADPKMISVIEEFFKEGKINWDLLQEKIKSDIGYFKVFPFELKDDEIEKLNTIINNEEQRRFYEEIITSRADEEIYSFLGDAERKEPGGAEERIGGEVGEVKPTLAENEKKLTELTKEQSKLRSKYNSAVAKFQKLKNKLQNAPELGGRGQVDIEGKVAGVDVMDLGGEVEKNAKIIVRDAEKEANDLKADLDEITDRIDKLQQEINNQKFNQGKLKFQAEAKGYSFFAKALGLTKTDLASSLGKTARNGKINGVNVVIQQGDNANEAIIESIMFRGRGKATNALRKLTAEADRMGITLKLRAVPEKGAKISQENLQRWYEKNGFVFAEGSNKGVRSPNIKLQAEQVKPIIEEETKYEVKINGEWYSKSSINVDENKVGDFVPELMKYPFEKVGETGYYNPNYFTEQQWNLINKELTRMGFEKRPTQDWKTFFNNKKNKRVSDEHLIAFDKVFGKEKVVKSTSQKIITKAKRYFGLTSNFKEVGYLTPDGDMLDFSGKKFGGERNTRAMDHREINSIDTDMREFTSMGNIRMHPESGSIELTVIPTREQVKTLLRYFQYFNGDSYVDFVNPETNHVEHYVEYNKTKASKIIGDIINYYQNGIKPISSVKYHIRPEVKGKERLAPVPQKVFDTILAKLFGTKLAKAIITDKAKMLEKLNQYGIKKLEDLKRQAELKLMATTSGEVYGFITPEGEVYIDPDKININTPIHEYGHLWINWAKTQAKNLFDKGMELADDKTNPYFQKIWNNPAYATQRQQYEAGNKEAFLEEVLATAIGDKGEQFVNAKQKSDFKQWMKDLFDAIKQALGISQYSADQLQDITFDEFSKAVAVELLKGEEIKAKSNIDKATQLYYDLLDAEGATKKRSLAKQRRELLDSDPRLKYIDDNISEINSQLEKQGLIKKEGACP